MTRHAGIGRDAYLEHYKDAGHVTWEKVFHEPELRPWMFRKEERINETTLDHHSVCDNCLRGCGN